MYGKLDSGTQAELAKLYRNAESEEVGNELLNNRFKEIRKTIFPTSVYDENLTYEDIATPWRNFTFNKLGERMSETSPVFYEILSANDATKAAELTLIYGANNNNAKVLDDITDNAAQSLGVSPAGCIKRSSHNGTGKSVFRKDDLTGITVDRKRADLLIQTAGYTESYEEALSASTTLGGVNYTGTAGTPTQSNSIQLTDAAKKQNCRNR